MEDYYRMISISHEDFDPYLSLNVDLTADMNLVFTVDCSHPSEEKLNFIEHYTISKENTSLLALINHMQSVQELSDFFYNKFNTDGEFLDAGDVLDVIDSVKDYLEDHNIPYEYKVVMQKEE